jgi:hypothetical protein
MPTPRCPCGNRLFPGNSACTACGSLVGWCDACCQQSVLVGEGNEHCSRCNCRVALCPNRRDFDVCTSFVPIERDAQLCSLCQTSILVPDKSDADAVRLWRLAEAAKRRLLFELDRVGLDSAWREQAPALRFKFPVDQPDKQFVTGHAEGVITINLKEADSVHREAERLRMGEPQRTLIGHLRHEFGHYLDLRASRDAAWLGQRTSLFGDAEVVDYPSALERHYEQGPPADWPDHYISPYAASHPWEDFAETAAFYLDMRAVLDTLAEWDYLDDPVSTDFETALHQFESTAIVLNEVNRTMGLVDLVPQVVPPAVVEKLRLIDAAIRVTRQ